MPQPESSDRPLRAGVVGVGGISQHHAAGYRLAGCTLAAICDVDADMLRAKARDWGVERTYTSAEAMFAEADLDVVSICTPVSSHHPVTLAAARAGVHVLCEKPIALDLAQGREMIEACREAGVILQIGHQMRSDGAVSHAKAMIDDGTIGDISFVRLRQAHDWGGAGRVRPSFATKSSGGGGTLLDNGCHMMDLLRYFGGDVEDVYARTATRRWPIDLEDTSTVSARYVSGALASVENSWTATGWEEGFWIYGTAGSLEYTNRQSDPVLVHAFRESPGTTWAETDVARIDFAGAPPHHRQILNLVRAVRGEGPVVCSGEDGLDAVRIVFAAYESAAANRPVRLGEESETLAAAAGGVAG